MIVGALGTSGRARVDERGEVQIEGEGWSLDWWIGADDRWRVPAEEAAVRAGALGAAPVSEVRARVPGGDAVQRVYGIGGPGGVVVLEVENASAAAFVVAFVVRGARSIALDGNRLEVDGRAALVLPFTPPRWSQSRAPLEPAAVGADQGRFPPRSDHAARIHAALLYPLSHRNRLRVALVTGPDAPGPVDLALLPTAERVAGGWASHLGRGMQVVLPDHAEQDAVDAARAQVLLDPDPGAATAAALEDWGFDREAEWAWRGLTWRARRAARRRDLTGGDGPAGRLLATRAALVCEQERELLLLPAPRSEWLGHDLEAHDVPTRWGTVGYALRWHGERPALLWEVRDPDPDLVVRAPALAPGWSSRRPRGDALLDPPPGVLDPSRSS